MTAKRKFLLKHFLSAILVLFIQFYSPFSAADPNNIYCLSATIETTDTGLSLVDSLKGLMQTGIDKIDIEIRNRTKMIH